MMETVNYLLNLPDQMLVGFNVTTISGRPLKKSGTLFITDPPVMEIKVSPETFPDPEQIDLNSDCLVFLETAEVVTLVCTLKDITANGVVHIKLRDLIQHSDKRKYYRGPAGRLTIFCAQKKKENDASGALEFFQAGGVNISCGGLLITMDRPLAKKEILALDIQTPEPFTKIISCHGMVVRVQKFQDSYFIGIKFTDLDSSMCDEIMAFCFSEQRRMLREMVITKDM